MLEKQIEKKVCDYAKSHGMIAFKFSSPGRAAVPDRLFVAPGGVMFFIELKAEGKKPTPAQVREISRLRIMGVAVFVVDNVDDGKRIIDQVTLGINPRSIKGC